MEHLSNSLVQAKSLFILDLLIDVWYIRSTVVNDREYITQADHATVSLIIKKIQQICYYHQIYN